MFQELSAVKNGEPGAPGLRVRLAVGAIPWSETGNVTGKVNSLRGNTSISRMPGCGPNALPKNWI